MGVVWLSQKCWKAYISWILEVAQDRTAFFSVNLLEKMVTWLVWTWQKNWYMVHVLCHVVLCCAVLWCGVLHCESLVVVWEPFWERTTMFTNETTVLCNICYSVIYVFCFCGRWMLPTNILITTLRSLVSQNQTLSSRWEKLKTLAKQAYKTAQWISLCEL